MTPVLVTVLMATFVVLGAGPAAAERTVGWAQWGPITGTSNNYATTMQLPGLGFPAATVRSDSRGPVQIPSGASTFLGATGDPVPTAVGNKYGSSRNNAYLNLRPRADTATAPSRTTYTFDDPTPDTGWTFVLGDIDSDQVQVSAKDADGQPIGAATINGWFKSAFNYVGGADLPTWVPATSTLVGNPAALDTDGASAWFEPDVSLSALSFVFTRRAGFPIFQTWFAAVNRTIAGAVADRSAPGGSCPIDESTVRLFGPSGNELAAVHPVSGVYSFGQVATQAGYTVAVDPPPGCAVIGSRQLGVSTAGSDAVIPVFDLRQVIPQPVRGTVLTAGGDPVAGATVTLTRPDSSTVTTTTEADGTYLFDNNQELPGYTVALTVPAGYAASGPVSRTFDIDPGQPVPPQDFTLQELPSISGTVTGGGATLPGVTVTLTPDNGDPPTSTVTDADGLYVFPALPAGGYQVAVTAPDGYAAAPPPLAVGVGSDDVSGQNFALSRPGALGGAVTDTSGAPLAGTTVTVTGPSTSQILTSDADGEYFLDQLPPGTYTIALTVPAGYTAAGPTTSTVTITSAGEIQGGQNFVLAVSPTSPPPTSPVPPPTSPGPGVPAPGDPARTSAQLASTGANVQAPFLLGLGLVVLGGLACVSARRRRVSR